MEDYASKWAYGYIVGTRPLGVDDLENEGKFLFGVWTDENGARFYDVVVHVDGLGDARELGTLFNQRAIWSLREDKELYL